MHDDLGEHEYASGSPPAAIGPMRQEVMTPAPAAAHDPRATAPSANSVRSEPMSWRALPGQLSKLTARGRCVRGCGDGGVACVRG